MASSLTIRAYSSADEAAVIDVWRLCCLTRPQNNAQLDIERKLKVNPELFLVGLFDGRVVSTAMVGHEGHRGWVNYLGVHPAYQRRGFGRQLMEFAEEKLLALGCPKINLQIRKDNLGAVQFYERIGYGTDEVISMGKRLIPD